ncbi:unnamed protein product [Ectocarpus sp. CCAP 1310/34]|nr:unnamed protein product [Ectocarpus sp. CCAP 1310/34]
MLVHHTSTKLTVADVDWAKPARLAKAYPQQVKTTWNRDAENLIVQIQLVGLFRACAPKAGNFNSASNTMYVAHDLTERLSPEKMSLAYVAD